MYSIVKEEERLEDCNHERCKETAQEKTIYELGAGVYREQFATNRVKLAETGKKACTGNGKTAKRQRPARRFRCNREWYNAKYSGQ
jgi:hypothetical protein